MFLTLTASKTSILNTDISIFLLYSKEILIICRIEVRFGSLKSYGNHNLHIIIRKSKGSFGISQYVHYLLDQKTMHKLGYFSKPKNRVCNSNWTEWSNRVSNFKFGRSFQ